MSLIHTSNRNVKVDSVILSAEEHNRISSLLCEIDSIRKAKAIIVHDNRKDPVRYECISHDSLLKRVEVLGNSVSTLKKSNELLRVSSVRKIKRKNTIIAFLIGCFICGLLGCLVGSFYI